MFKTRIVSVQSEICRVSGIFLCITSWAAHNDYNRQELGLLRYSRSDLTYIPHSTNYEKGRLMGGGHKVDKTARKADYFVKMAEFLAEYNQIMLVNADNVGSSQMQQIRKALRGDAIIFMGKNTLMKKAIRGYLEHNPDLERLLPHIKNNVGMVFTHLELKYIRDKLLENKKAAPAKTGAIAPMDVYLPKGSCGLGPEKTTFFQNLTIPTKISRGQIELLTEVHLIKKDLRVGASEATLLNMLNISPFSYGLKVVTVYDKGSIYKAEMLDLTDADVMKIFSQGVSNVNATALGNYSPYLNGRGESIFYYFFD